MPFFSLSPQFGKYKKYILSVYSLAILDIVLTYLTVHYGCIEVNPIASILISVPLLFIAWKFAGITLIMTMPYYLSELFHKPMIIWLALLGATVFPVANNFVMLILNIA